MCLLVLNLFNTNWGVTKKHKTVFLINYSPVQRPTLSLNGMLYKKNYMLKMMKLHPNLATNASAVAELNSLLITTLTYDTYMNILNHIFNSAKQHITMFEWKNEYITCLCLISKTQRFFASNNQPRLLTLTKLWLRLLAISSTSSFKKIKLIIFLKIHFSIFHLYLPYIIKFPCNIFADVFSNYSSSTFLQQPLLQSCSNLFLNFSFHYSLIDVPSFSGFLMGITRQIT